MDQYRVKKIIQIATQTGKIMLQNGAETYRVEDTVQRMAESRGLSEVNVFVIPTGIIISATYNDMTISLLERVNPEGIDLECIDRANAFSREFTSTEMTLEAAEERIQDLNSPPRFKKWIRVLSSGMGGGFFVLMFGGTAIEFLIGYLASSLTVLWTEALDNKHLNFFIKNILGGFAAALFGVVFVRFIGIFDLSASINTVIIGPLMTLVPGVSLTNGIRDLISGELLAGSAKIMEALFIAIALAFGVGMVLQFSLKFIS
ncbi:MAG: hypothetical protein BGO41_14225 [Clostridiales bacterium 38-18]|nr:MAG: hypothetical protein BGO41_14225 [Clostridiales bacterium 38-18]